MAFETLVGEWNGQRRQIAARRILVGLDMEDLRRRRVELTEEGLTKALPQLLAEVGLPRTQVLEARANFPIVEIELQEASDPTDSHFPTTAARELDENREATFVTFAEPVFLVWGAADTNDQPTDKYYEESFPDDYFPGPQTAIKAINAQGAWAPGIKGAQDVLIGIADSGVPVKEIDGSLTLTHPDLNSDRISLGQDYVAKWHGGPVMNDTAGHGTHVLGIIAADSDNEIGVAGVNWQSPVFVVRILNKADGFTKPNSPKKNPITQGEMLVGYGSALVFAICDIVTKARTENKRVVINLSLAFRSFDGVSYLDEEVKAVTVAFQWSQKHNDEPAHDVLFCVAAGNALLGKVHFPGTLGLTNDYVVTVGSATQDLKYISTQSALGAAITLVAPGEKILSTLPAEVADNVEPYGRLWGTSMATAFVTGVASLMWSANRRLTPAQIKACLVSSATNKATLDDPPTKYWALNAGAAVTSAKGKTEIEVQHVNFNVVPPYMPFRRCVTIRTLSCGTYFFHFTGWPQSRFTVPRGPFYCCSPFCASRWNSTQICIQFTGAHLGESIWEMARIECKETGDSWPITMTASVRRTERVTTMLVLDTSKTMGSKSSSKGISRFGASQEALLTLLTYISSEDRVGVVRFRERTKLISKIEDVGTKRAKLMAAVESMTRGKRAGSSIGAALGIADKRLAADPEALAKATVLVVGGENGRAKDLASVIPHLENRVFVVAIGNQRPMDKAAINALAKRSGGEAFFVGELEGEDRFKLFRYYLQIYANLKEEALVASYNGQMPSGQSLELPFDVNGGDQRTDVVLMTTTPDRFSLSLVGPDEETHITKRRKGVKIVDGAAAHFYRLDLAKLEKAGIRVRGRWQARLKLGRGKASSAERGVPFSLAVLTRSPITMSCRLEQQGFEPGDAFELQASIHDGGLPPETVQNIDVTVKRPDGSLFRAALDEKNTGGYTTTIQTGKPGIYECRIVARGLASDGRAFKREHTCTATIWYGGNTAADRVQMAIQSASPAV